MSFALACAALAAAACSAQPVTLGEEIAARGPQGPLRGSYVAAGPAAPLVLIIPGSGPTDRDGNNPLGVAAAPYRMLAGALAERGVSSVRIDKRGLFGSAAAGDGNAVTIADYVQDVRAWQEAVRARTNAPCVWLLGHSEGALVALAAAQDAAHICGLVLIAGPGRRLGDSLREQLRANPANAPLLDQALSAIAQLERGERVDVAPLHPALGALFAPEVQGFLISAFAQDPAELAGRVRVPTLIVQGLRDLQVTEVDARRLAAAAPQARLVLLPDVNHVLKRVAEDDRAANLRTYADPAAPLAEGVADPIAAFVRGGAQASR